MFKTNVSEDKKITALSRGRHLFRGSSALSVLLRAVPVALIAASFAGEANAQAVNWLGGNGNWNDAAKWSSGTVPNGVFPDATPTPTVIGPNTAGTVTINTNNAVTRNIQVGNGHTLQIISGGVLTTTPAITSNSINTIGLAGIGTGTGTMLIDGANSRWDAGNAGVRVGNGATGTLTVSNGGVLNMTNGLLSVGLNASGKGTLNINGGTVTNPAAAIRLGFNGATGELNITNGGSLTTTMLNHIGQTDVAGAGKGIVNISGAGSIWTISAGTPGASGNLALGRGAGAEGTITISNGGKMVYRSADQGAPAFGYQGGTGAMTVRGTGSLFDTATGLTLGEGAGSTGTLTITDNAMVNSTTNNVLVGHFGGTGTLNISNGGQLTTDRDVFVGNSGNSTGTLNITSGGKLVMTNAAYLNIGAQAAGTGTVDGVGSEVTGAGLTVGQAATGLLTLSNGGKVTASNFTTIGQTGGTGTLNIVSGGKLSVGNYMNVGWDQGTGITTVSGAGSRIDVVDHIALGVDTGTGTSKGTMTVTDGAVVKTPQLIVGFGVAGQGTLNIGAGGAAGTIDGMIRLVGASALVNFNHTDANYTFANAINDWDHANGIGTASGSVNFIGSGTTTLTAVSDYSVATNINAGKVIVASGASIANSSLTTVNSGGTLAGAGSVGNVMVANGGTIAQNGSDKLTVKDITFAAGSIYRVGINPNGQNGSIVANTATLNGGTVQVNAGTGNFAPGMTYTILNTAGGVTGQFANTVSTDLVFLSAGLDYTNANKVDVALTRNATSFASIAATANQRAVAAGAASLPANNPVYAAVVQQNVAGAQAAYDALSGDAHASAQGALINNALLVGDAINGRLLRPFGSNPAPVVTSSPVTRFAEDAHASLNYAEEPGKVAAKSPWMARKAPVMVAPPVVYASWAEGFGGWLNQGSDGNAGRMKSSTAGVVSGIDATVLSTYRFGLAGGYSRSDISVSSRSSSLEVDSYHISGYAGARQGGYGLQGGLIYSWNEVASNRTVAFPGFVQNLLASYQTGTMQLFGEANYQFLAGGTAVQAFAGFNYLNHHTNEFSETGGAAALNVATNNRDVVFTTVGLRSSALLAQSGDITFVGRGTLGWRHAIGNTDTAISAAFAGGTPFTVAGTPIAVDAVYGEAGLDMNINPKMTLGVAWSGQFGTRADENRVKGQFVYRW